jgi:hypothetical protein
MLFIDYGAIIYLFYFIFLFLNQFYISKYTNSNLQINIHDPYRKQIKIKNSQRNINFLPLDISQ